MTKTNEYEPQGAGCVWLLLLAMAAAAFGWVYLLYVYHLPYIGE